MSTKVGSRIIIDTFALQALDRAQINALCMTADEVMTELKNAGVMPFDKGDMQNAQTGLDDSKSASGIVSIVTSSPQARRLYFHPEFNYTKKDNTAAGGKWFERFRTVDRIPDIYAKLFKMLGGL